MNIYDGNNISPEFSKNGLVEVLGENGAFYPAYIFDVDSLSPSPLPTASGDTGVSSFSNAANGQSSGESLITVTFQNNSYPKSTLPISRIRLPPINVSINNSNESNLNANNQEEAIKNLTSGLSSVHLANNSQCNANSQTNAANNLEEIAAPFSFSIGMEVEVLSSCSKDEPRGWWRAIIKMIKGI